MAVTVEALKRKIAHLQEELAEVSAALDELGNGAAEATSETRVIRKSVRGSPGHEMPPSGRR